MSIRIHVDVDGWLDALDAHEGPGEETLEALSAVLALGFEQTQAKVHVITGSLRGSGRVSDRRVNDGWEGEITYGGPAPGYAHPFGRSAREECGRSEQHDALSNLHLLSSDFLDAMFATVRARLT
jgi:hypothetical protein